MKINNLDSFELHKFKSAAKVESNVVAWSYKDVLHSYYQDYESYFDSIKIDSKNKIGFDDFIANYYSQDLDIKSYTEGMKFGIIDASGDGIDSNGDLEVTGGVLIVYGPTSSGDGALDYDGNSSITGGKVIAFGMGGMAQNFNNATQGSILYNFNSSYKVDTLMSLIDSSNETLVSVKTKKTFNSIAVSTPDITNNGVYTLKIRSDSNSITMNGYTYSNGNGGGFGPGPGRH